jgi:hypothetical protein
MKLCASCKQMREPAATSDDLDYCEECLATNPQEPRPELVGLAYLLATIPFDVGDKVECRTAGTLYDGVGTVKEIDIDFKMGGTPVFPAFRVELEEKSESSIPDELWYTEMCLTKVGS